MSSEAFFLLALVWTMNPPWLQDLFSRLQAHKAPLLDTYWRPAVFFVLVILVLFFVRKLFFWLLSLSLRRWFSFWRIRHSPPSRRVRNGLSRPISTFLVLLLLLPIIPALHLPAPLALHLTGAIHFLLALLFTVSSCRLVDIAIPYLAAYLQRGKGPKTNKHLLRFGRVVLYIAVLFLGVSFMFSSLGWSLTHLLAGLSVGGLAVALAAQDTFKNLFGSVLILADRPFKEGDWIMSGEIDGVVEKIGLRATRIRTFKDSLLYVSNARLSESPIDNYGARTYRRYYARLPLSYRTSSEALHHFILGLRRVVEQHKRTRKDHEIHIHEYTSTHISVMLYIFFEVPDWSEELRCRHEINMEIRKLAESLGIDMGADFSFLSAKSSN